MLRLKIMLPCMLLAACSNEQSKATTTKPAAEVSAKPASVAPTAPVVADEAPVPVDPAEATVADETGAYTIVVGKQIGPIRVGMSQSEVEALGVLKTHPQYSAMTIPYTVYYEDDVVTGLEVSLAHAMADLRIGDLSIPRTSSMKEAAALLSDCSEPDMLIGGTHIRCLDGGISVGVGSGNPNEVWIRVPGATIPAQ